MNTRAKTIVVTGSHSVGKTTLCKKIIETLAPTMSICLIPEMARILIERGMPMNDEVTESAIVCYIAEYLKHTREADADVVISDRSVFDLYAYISHRRSDCVRVEYLDMVREQVAVEVARVCTYVYVPIECEMVVDHVRSKDIKYREAIDLNVRRLLVEFGASVFEVRGSLSERTRTVLEFLRGNSSGTGS